MQDKINEAGGTSQAVHLLSSSVPQIVEQSLLLLMLLLRGGNRAVQETVYANIASSQVGSGGLTNSMMNSEQSSLISSSSSFGPSSGRLDGKGSLLANISEIIQNNIRDFARSPWWSRIREGLSLASFHSLFIFSSKKKKKKIEDQKEERESAT